MRARTGTIQTWSRRSVLGAGLYSAALLVPAFHELAGRAEAVRAGRTVRIGDGDVATVRRMTDKVAEILDEIGAGHARPMAAAFLANTVGPYLKASGPERVRREMRAAAADLVYLTGWMAMYEDRQALGQRYYVKALRLAGEAEDHITYCRTLRGMSLQASHLGYGPKALELADGAAAAAPSAGPRLLNYSIDNFGDSGDQTGRDQLYGLDRYRLADFGRSESGAFLRALASDADAYETVSAAQQLYGTSMMAAAGDATDAQTIGKHSVYMHGALDGARSEAIGMTMPPDGILSFRSKPPGVSTSHPRLSGPG
ncbi:putative sporulation protein [Streptomyces fradiae ATCC 10745 = DSM 40063]|uniref:Putative sporulation protein n=1 Tax=Streptomyces fradiae ATCC 10745 = DSM 40063 TaxID=1319510 RepID=A0A1Y2NQV2_STRFR|nr:putative sporulation protein [Streptomyces fradiae ATCC 10745 = DSM 40063]